MTFFAWLFGRQQHVGITKADAIAALHQTVSVEVPGAPRLVGRVVAVCDLTVLVQTPDLHCQPVALDQISRIGPATPPPPTTVGPLDPPVPPRNREVS